MECRFTSDCVIQSVDWFKEGIRLLPAMRDYEIAISDQYTTLTIQETMQTDTAIYTVRIGNEAGGVESSAKLSVKGSS